MNDGELIERIERRTLWWIPGKGYCNYRGIPLENELQEILITWKKEKVIKLKRSNPYMEREVYLNK